MERKQKRNRRKLKKKESNYSKFWVSFCLLAILIFTVIVLFLFYRTGAEPSTLIKYFYSVFGVELAGMAGIKIAKHKYNSDDFDNFG